MVIGKVFSSRELGYYVLAARIPALFSDSLTTIVSRVTLPVYPGLRDDPARFRGTLRKALTMMAAINTPVMVGIYVMAEPIVQVVLTEKWLPAVPYMRMCCLWMAISPLQQANLEALLCLGKSGLWLRLHVVRKALSLLNMAVFYRWGIQALLLGFGMSLVVLCLGALGVSRCIGYTPWQQTRDLLPYGMASLAMGGIVFLAGHVDLHVRTVAVAFMV